MKTFVYRKSKILRRVCAVLIDLLICICAFLFLYVLISEPIIKSTRIFKETYQKFEEVHLNSKLYEKNEAGGLSIINEDMDDNLIYFFTNYDSIDNYNNLKKESGCFICDNNTGLYVENGSKEDLSAFYNEALKKAYDIFTSREDYLLVTNRLNTLNMIMIVPSLSLGVVVAFLVPSLFLKGRKTIGMLLFHLAYISHKSGLIAQKIQIIFKFLLFFIFEYILSIFYGVGLLLIFASTISMIVTKKRTSLLDIICQVVIIDDFPQGQASKSDEIVIAIGEYKKEGEENEETKEKQQ